MEKAGTVTGPETNARGKRVKMMDHEADGSHSQQDNGQGTRPPSCRSGRLSGLDDGCPIFRASYPLSPPGRPSFTIYEVQSKDMVGI